MTGPTVTVLPDAAGVATHVATRLLELLAEAQAEGRVPHVALTGGTIAVAIHREAARLAAQPAGWDVDWARVVFWWGDERFVAPDSPDRNAQPARRDFLDVVGVPDENVHEMPSTADAVDVASGAASYATELRAEGSGEFELVMLGIGPDAHVASLFPGFPQVDVVDEIAVPVTGSPKPPPERITLTLPALNRSRSVWFVASGAEKAPAVARALETTRAGDPETAGPAAVPAARVHGRLSTTWFVDAAAAGLVG